MKEKKDAFLILRISKEWKDKLLEKAKVAKMKLSEYIREQLWRIEDLER